MNSPAYQTYLEQLPSGEAIKSNLAFYQEQLPGRETMARKLNEKMPDARDVSIMKHKVADGFKNMYSMGEGYWKTPTPKSPEAEAVMDLDEEDIGK